MIEMMNESSRTQTSQSQSHTPDFFQATDDGLVPIYFFTRLNSSAATAAGLGVCWEYGGTKNVQLPQSCAAAWLSAVVYAAV